MADRGKSGFVDGLVTLRATQLRQRERKYSSAEAEETTPQAETVKKPTDAKKAMQIGRTVMPTQNEIVCYACNFKFVMRGRAEVTQCPKCGARLSLKDEKITGGFPDELVTAGKVTLTRSAILDGGQITANNITLEGLAKSGSLKAFQTLELAEGAAIPEDMVDARHLRIGVGASFDFHSPMTFGDLDIQGELKADIVAEGMVTIRSTGHYLGRLKAAHLVVEDGAGLNADVRIIAPGQEIDPDEDDRPAAEIDEATAPPKITLPI